MFFIISKILVFIISPVSWIAGLLLFSLFAKNQKRKRITFIAGVVILLFFSNSFVLDEAMRAWEIPATRYEDLATYDAGIVLGGMVQYDEEYDRLQFYRGVDRLLQTVELYKKGKIRKILFTGGSGSIIYKDKKEAPLVKRYLLTIGIPEEDIIIESESKNTRENALNTKHVIDSLSLKGKFLLITSSFHMRRSMRCFEKAGIVDITSYSTDRYSGKRKFFLDHLFIPNTQSLENWDLLLHEIIGYIVYYCSGYI